MATKRIVQCGLCRREHFLAVPDPSQFQAGGCSIFLIKRKGVPLLLGCYGSEYDMSLFRVFCDLKIGPDDPICDVCVDALQATGDVCLIPGRFMMVPTNYTPPNGRA